MASRNILVCLVLLGIGLVPHMANGLLKRCSRCRSRGERGTCKDPFPSNMTEVEKLRGVEIIPCASGWCGKIIETEGLNNEYGVATERHCLQRGPDDGEERCAYTTRNYKKVYICFCMGDVCNGSTAITFPSTLTFTCLAILRGWLI